MNTNYHDIEEPDNDHVVKVNIEIVIDWEWKSFWKVETYNKFLKFNSTSEFEKWKIEIKVWRGNDWC
jgi:hypothetical protein